MKMQMKNRSHGSKVDLGLDMSTNMMNIKSVSVWWCNTYATFEVEFMKKLSNTEAELEKKCCL